MVRSPGFDPLGRHGKSGGKFIQLLKYKIHFDLPAETPGSEYFTEFLFEKMTNHEDDLTETGPDRIVNRVVDNRFAVRAYAVHLFERTITRPHPGRQNQKCRFNHFCKYMCFYFYKPGEERIIPLRDTLFLVKSTQIYIL